jgi:ketosteroid isomerase-like protein
MIHGPINREIPMSNNEAEIIRVCHDYSRAVDQKDVGAFLSLYDPGARIFDPWGKWSYEGVAERSKAIDQWFGSLGEERVAVTFDRIQVMSGLEHATLTARVVYAAISAVGEELRSMQNRLTWVLKSESGGWKIVHEHTSVPIGPDLKGLLGRE